MLYANIGPVLSWFDLDVDAATLSRRGSISLPVNVQYAWPDRQRRILYVASSNGGPMNLVGNTHHLSAFRIDPKTGALEPFGVTQNLRARPLHVSLDQTGRFVLTAYNFPSNLTVHHVEADGSVGAEVQQPDGLDVGITAHQVRATPSNQFVLLPTRGEYEEPDKPEEPGALKIFHFKDGVLSNSSSYAPNGGFGYGPRHVDFHPTLELAYHLVERQNQLETFALDKETGVRGPLFRTTTLLRPDHPAHRQMAGAIHVHPNGRFVYASNRSIGNGGEDNIAVFSIDAVTGEPRLIQNIEGGGIHMRTFSIDETGRILVAASTKAYVIPKNGQPTTVAAAQSVFRIKRDGTLELARKYDIDVGSHEQFWTGMA